MELARIGGRLSGLVMLLLISLIIFWWVGMVKVIVGRNFSSCWVKFYRSPLSLSNPCLFELLFCIIEWIVYLRDAPGLAIEDNIVINFWIEYARDMKRVPSIKGRNTWWGYYSWLFFLATLAYCLHYGMVTRQGHRHKS